MKALVKNNRRAHCAIAAALALGAASSALADIAAYAQDFEALDMATTSALADDGWLVFGNVFDPVGGFIIYNYGPFPAPNGGQAFSAIVTGQGGPPQGNQQLSVYNDYNNSDSHGLRNLVEANVYQESIIGAADVGSTWTFSFDAKLGNIEGSSTAAAFIKTIDQNVGSALTNFITTDMTSTPVTWTGYEMSILIDASLVGQLFQFGFLSTATNFEGSGIYYDNINVGVATPANDDCDGAIPVAVPSVTPGSTVDATLDPVSGGFCGTSITAPGVWYSVLGDGDLYTADTCSGTNYDSKISVFEGSCAAPICVGGNDDSFAVCGGLQSLVSWPTQPGVEYLILVHGFAGAVGNFDLTLSSQPDCNANGIGDIDETEPEYNPGDPVLSALDCGNAEYICPGFAYLGGTVPLAPGVNQALFCGVFFGANDVFYRYRPTYSGQAYVSVQGPPLDWLIAVHADCPATGANQIACNQFATGAFFNAQAGQEYIIRVAAAGFAAGPFILTLNGPDCLTNVNDINQNGAPDECDCLADVNGDYVVDMADYMAVLLAQGPCGACPEDIDQSGVVDANDLQLVLINQGPCPFSNGITAPVVQSLSTRDARSR